MAGERILLIQGDPTTALEETLRAREYSVSTPHPWQQAVREAVSVLWDAVIVSPLLPAAYREPAWATVPQHCHWMIVAAEASELVLLSVHQNVLFLPPQTPTERLVETLDGLFPWGKAQHVGPWLLDAEHHALTRGTERHILHAQEFRLLQYFATHPCQVLSRPDILKQVWGYDSQTTTRTVDVHVAKLRHWLGESRRALHIQTIRGQGYRFIP